MSPGRARPRRRGGSSHRLSGRGGDDLMPVCASAFVFPAEVLVREKFHRCLQELYSAGVCEINLQNI